MLQALQSLLPMRKKTNRKKEYPINLLITTLSLAVCLNIMETVQLHRHRMYNNLLLLFAESRSTDFTQLKGAEVHRQQTAGSNSSHQM